MFNVVFLKPSKNLLFSDVFRNDPKRTIRKKWVNENFFAKCTKSLYVRNIFKKFNFCIRSIFFQKDFLRTSIFLTGNAKFYVMLRIYLNIFKL